MAIQKPKPASTVILSKITTKWPHKILLIKRSLDAAFLPGAHVFPGGSIEESDKVFGQILAKDLVNIKRIKVFFKTKQHVILMHLAAAIRETLEETGLSILKVIQEEKPKFLNPLALKSLIELQKDNPLEVNLENIWPISWWITPNTECRRFNTWFFYAALDESALNHQLPFKIREASESLWLTPKQALTAYNSNQIFLAPPTRTILERMDNTKTFQEFTTFVDRPLFPIRPYFYEGTACKENKKHLILPGDPLHKEARRPLMPMHTRYSFP